MKRLKRIEGDQLANPPRHEVFDELLPKAPHQKGVGMQSSRTSLPYSLKGAGLIYWQEKKARLPISSLIALNIMYRGNQFIRASTLSFLQ